MSLILVVEKEGTFQQLLSQGADRSLNAVLITGRGFPDLMTRAFLHRVASLCACRVLALVRHSPVLSRLVLSCLVLLRPTSTSTSSPPSLFSPLSLFQHNKQINRPDVSTIGSTDSIYRFALSNRFCICRIYSVLYSNTIPIARVEDSSPETHQLKLTLKTYLATTPLIHIVTSATGRLESSWT